MTNINPTPSILADQVFHHPVGSSTSVARGSHVSPNPNRSPRAGGRTGRIQAILRTLLRTLENDPLDEPEKTMRSMTKFPMPVERLFYHPEALTLGPAPFGMLTRLLLHFWMTDCRPLPEADYNLRAIARAHPPTWRKHREAILRVFSDLAPDLARHYRARQSRRENLRIASDRSASARRHRAAMARVPGTPEYAALHPDAPHGVNLLIPKKDDHGRQPLRMSPRKPGKWAP